MNEAAAGKKCAMSAILGLSSEDVTKACEDYMKEHADNSEDIYVTVSNYNCTGQCVICGTQRAVEDMEGILKEKGAKRCVRVNVSGPFHTKYMKEAGDALESYFNEKPLNTPSLPVLLNATGDYYKDGDDLSKQLIKQVQSSVRLEENIEKLLDSDIDTFIEIGPGKVVSGFLKRMTKGIDRDIKLLNIDTVDDYKATAPWSGFGTILPIPLAGDANGNGEVEIGDVTSVLTLMATPEATGYNNKAADANGNGEIEIGDVTTILTIMAGN